MSFFGFTEKIRPNNYCLWEDNLFVYMQIFRLTCQSEKDSQKIAAQNGGCVFTYFCGGHKNNFLLQFRSSFNSH